MSTFIYDGTYEGFLTLVFQAYKRKVFPSFITHAPRFQASLLETHCTIETSTEQAQRVLKGIESKTSPQTCLRTYKAFLSELPDIEMTLFHYIKLLLEQGRIIEENYADPFVLKVKQTVKQVDREVHRMHAFVRFQLLKDKTWFSCIEPDFNVIPLIGDHFEKRYADQPWIIYDSKRKYGLYYDLSGMREVYLEALDPVNTSEDGPAILHEDEAAYQALWKNYFNSVNITERKNIRLHLKHVPKRYWKYLPEKH